ncbi:MAG: hypothetical protein Q9Q40_15500 [Acidobacteriota bacterium]|nr:hypothetical protein [Acidobacteriota bacterium]
MRPFPDNSPSDDFLDQVIAAAGFEPASEMEVVRLRRRVRDAVGGTHPHRVGGRYAMAAAAAVFAFLTLTGLKWQPLTPASLALSLTEDGAVRIAYADGRPIGRVIKTQAPMALPVDVERVAGAREYLDKNGQPRPGTVVFYRVD